MKWLDLLKSYSSLLDSLKCDPHTLKQTKTADSISAVFFSLVFDYSNNAVCSLRTVSQEISEKLETIVGIAEETTAGAQQTSESSHEVARLAEELQQSIRQFKV